MAARGPGERSALQMARAYAAVGWPVFPVAPGGKMPAFRAAHPADSPEASTCHGECGRIGHGLYDATTDPKLIERWWRENPHRNVGIATGAPGPDVLDIDVKPAGDGFAALNRVKRAGLAEGQQAIVKTPSSGMHLYYRGTSQGNGADHRNHIDFRSKGGYVVAPPSSTPDGAYVVVQHHAEAEATLDWGKVREVLEPEALRRQRELAAQHAPLRFGTTKGDEGRVGRVANFVAQGVPNDRNFRVFWAAKQLALSGQLDGQSTEILVDAALRAGLKGGEREARRSIASGQRDALKSAPAGPGKAAAEPPPPASPGGEERRPFVPSLESGDEREREAG
jgi:hypothetical protein